MAQGDATSEGVEVDLLWALTDRFRVSFVGTWLNAEYDNFIGSCYFGQVENGTGCVQGGSQGGVGIGTQDLSGLQMVFAPDWSHVLGADWSMPVGADNELTFSAKWIHVGEHFTSIERDPLGFQSATDRFDATVAVSSEDWELALIGRNLTDELVHNFGNATSLSGSAIYATNIEETRSIGLRATYYW